MVSLKNVTTEPVFTIEKQCDRCRNVLYFADTVITDIETDADGRIVRSSIVCPICGNVIELYSIEREQQPTFKIIG
jgi:ribosomal protein S27AE